jgi:hypothetical protein
LKFNNATLAIKALEQKNSCNWKQNTYHARVGGQCDLFRALELASQTLGKQNVGQFGHGVKAHQVVRLGSIQVVELNPFGYGFGLVYVYTQTNKPIAESRVLRVQSDVTPHYGPTDAILHS